MSVINDESFEGLDCKGYIERYRQNKLLGTDSNLPFLIIKAYLQSEVTIKASEKIYKNFKAKFILPRNGLKVVPAGKPGVKCIASNNSTGHTKEEILGLADVYEYISNYAFDNICNFTIYELINIHKILFSHTPFPQYAGLFRNSAAIVSKCGLEFVEYSDIPARINELGYELKKILRKPSNVEKYIISCIRLQAKLFNVLPFSEGNGRCLRAFFDLLMKYVGLPPIYIMPEEKEKYCSSLEIAILENDTIELEKFFLFKIANAIIENEDKYSKELIKTL
jgi:fido (protein-threonine AMPylation protein)